MCNQRFNGWSNHATWLVDLWLTNESDISYLAGEYSGNVSDVADAIEEIVREQMDSFNANGMIADMLSSFTENVNWREIAESICEGYETESEADDV